MKFLANLSKKQIIIIVAAIVIGIGAITAVAINVGGGKEKTVEDTEKETEKTIAGNGITITGKLGNAAKIKSEEIKEDSELYKEVADQVKNEVVVSFVSTDVKLLDKKDKEVQPEGKVKVTMTIPDSLVSGDDYQYDKTLDVFKVYTKSKSNGINLLDSDLSKDGKTITFETSYVSEFTISKENKDRSIESVEQLVTPVDKTMVAANDTTAYEGPDATYVEVGKLTQGQEVKVVGQYQKNEWYKVQVSEDKTGYVNPADLAEKQETTEEQPAEETNNVDNSSDEGSSSNSSNSSSSSSKKNNSGSSQSASSGSGSGQSDNQAAAPQPQAPSNPKAGVAETFYDGSIANGLSADMKAHVDSLVNSWKNGGYSNSGLADAIDNYLFENGVTCSGVNVEKDARFLISSGQSYSLSDVASGGIYYYGKRYTNGEMDGDSRVGYNSFVSIY